MAASDLKSLQNFLGRMLQYEKIDVSEGIDTNKTKASKECTLFQYWYFKDVGFKFEPHVCNECMMHEKVAA